MHTQKKELQKAAAICKQNCKPKCVEEHPKIETLGITVPKIKNVKQKPTCGFCG